MESPCLPWRRWILPLGKRPEADRYGWPLSALFAGAAPGRSLADEWAVPLLVLRGDRGMGGFHTDWPGDQLPHAISYSLSRRSLVPSLFGVYVTIRAPASLPSHRSVCSRVRWPRTG